MAVMTSIRERMHVLLWALLILFLLSMTIGGLVGGADIIDQLFGRVDPSKAIAMINGETISPDEFNQLVSQELDQIRSRGQQITDQDMDATRTRVWDYLVQFMLIRQTVNELGLSASSEEVLYHLRNNPPPFIAANPAFQTNGQFDNSKYQNAINNPQGNEWLQVEKELKNSYIPSYKLQHLINAGVVVTSDEVWDEYILKNVDYTINAIHVTPKILNTEAVEPTEKALRDYYQEHKKDYHREELRSIRFVSWEKRASQDDSSMIFKEAVGLKLQALAGKNFNDLADEFTEDPGNQITPDSGRGGDLGWFGRGQMVPSFEEAAFQAEPGDVVGPVVSQFGYHVIKVLEKRQTEGGEQVHAAHILLQIKMGPSTRDELRRKATLFSYDAQDFGFDAALDSNQVTASKAEKLRSNAPFIPGIGPMRSAIYFAFNRQVGDVSDPLENDNAFVVIVLDSIAEAGIAPFEDVQRKVRGIVIKKNQMEASHSKIDSIKTLLDEGATFEDIFARYEQIERAVNDTKPLSRGFNSVGRSYYVVGALLHAQAGDRIGPLQTARGYAIIDVLDIEEVDSTDFNIQKNVILKDLQANRQNEHFTKWLEDLKANAEIVDNRKYYF